MKRNIFWLYFAFVVELLFFFYIKNAFEFILCPIVLLAASVFISVFPFFLIKANQNTFLESNSFNKLKFDLRIKSALILFLLLTSTMIFIANWVIKQNPINIIQSDIIPFIDEIFVKRFLNHENVYAQYTGFNYGTFTPSYLPFHWGPFVLCKLLRIDYQWTALLVFMVFCTLYFLVLIKNIQNTRWLLVNSALPFVLLFTIYLKSGRSAVQCVEVMVMGYYLFLSIAIFSKQHITKGLGLLMPLLSRYSFVFWLPLYFYDLLRTNLKNFFWILIVFVALMLIFFVFPFVVPVPQMVKLFNANYTASILGEWDGQSWQGSTERPYQLFQGIGFASWFYQFAAGTLLERMELNKYALYIISILTMLFVVYKYKYIRKYIGPNMFSLLSLKLMLTIFYALIMVPYDYLNWVSLTISIVILSRINYSLELK
jgi:hypothetical protein